MKVNILINGIRHNIPEEIRDEFYTTIVGQELIVVPEPTNPKNELAMAAMYRGNIAGHVSENTLPLSWSCYDEKKKRMRMTVVDVDRVSNSLKVCCDTHRKKIVKKKLHNVMDSWDWDYDGPMLKESEEMFVLNFNADLLLDDLVEGMEWNEEMDCSFEKVVSNLYLDKSKEMQERLRKIIDLLENRNDLKRADRLERAITHSNNDECRNRTWKLIKLKSVSNSFKENARLWYDKAKVKDVIDKLPKILRERFRHPADILGFVTYHSLPKAKYMQLLSFVAALDVVDEWREGKTSYMQIFQKGSMNIQNIENVERLNRPIYE